MLLSLPLKICACMLIPSVSSAHLSCVWAKDHHKERGRILKQGGGGVTEGEERWGGSWAKKARIGGGLVCAVGGQKFEI